MKKRIHRLKYGSHKRTIHRLARRHHTLTGIDLNDLIAEGNYAFCLASRRFDPELASATTWVWKTVNMYLRAYCQKEKRHRTLSRRRLDLVVFVNPNNNKLLYGEHRTYMEEIQHPLQGSNFMLAMLSLSKKAQEMVQVIFNNQETFLDLRSLQSRAVPERDLCKAFTKRGFKWNEALAARREIKFALNSL